MGCRGQLKPVFALIFINFAFAIVNVLLKKIVDGGINHMAVVTYRLSISSIFLAPIAYHWDRKTRPKLTFQILCYLFLGALVGVALSQYLFLLGLQYTSATFSCAFLNTVPVSTFLLALPFGLEKVNMKSKVGRAKVLGAVICTTGAVILTLYKGVPLTKPPYGDMEHHADTMMWEKKTQSWVMGSLILMAGCLMWSSWFLIQAKISKKYPCQCSSTLIINFFGAIQSAIINSIVERNIAIWILKGKFEIISIVYSGVVGSGLCYVGMAWCVKQKGPVFTAAFTPFTQIFAAIFDSSILHDQIYLGSVIGSIVVILGLYILLWGKSNDAEEGVLKQSLAKEDRNRNGDVESPTPVTINSASS